MDSLEIDGILEIRYLGFIGYTFNSINEGLISVVLLPTPRGLVMAQKREGRK